jgi:DNA anti-recombination protein RmuC
LTQLEFLQAEFKGLKNNFVSSAAFESRIKEITHTFQAPLTATQEELVTLKSDFMGLAGRLDALEKQSDEKTAINAHDIQKLRKDMEDLISRIKNLFN